MLLIGRPLVGGKCGHGKLYTYDICGWSCDAVYHFGDSDLQQQACVVCDAETAGMSSWVVLNKAELGMHGAVQQCRSTLGRC